MLKSIYIRKLGLSLGPRVDLEIIILSEVSQTEKDKYHMMSLICGI